MPVNFGILQPTPGSTPNVQIVSTPASGGGGGDDVFSGLQAGLKNFQEMRMQNLQMENTRQQMDQSKQLFPGQLEQQKLSNQNISQQMDQRQQLFPGQLEEQRLANTGKGLLNIGQDLNNQKAQAELAQAKYAALVQQKAAQAYEEASNKGGTEAGLDAIGETYLRNGDPTAYTTMQKVRLEMKGQIAKNNAEGVMAVGDLTHQAITMARPAVTDPKTGAVLQPAVTSLDAYKQLYPRYKEQWPDAPKPESFTSDQQFQDTFAHPVLAAANPLKQQEAAKQEALKNDHLYQANLAAQEAVKTLKSAVQQYGPNSQESKDAAEAVRQAQLTASNIANGSGFVGNTVRSIYSNITNTPAKTIEKYNNIDQSEAPITTTTQTTSSASSGVPEGLTLEAIQAELANRSGNQ